jgi:hypothetical protein
MEATNFRKFEVTTLSNFPERTAIIGCQLPAPVLDPLRRRRRRLLRLLLLLLLLRRRRRRRQADARCRSLRALLRFGHSRALHGA